MKSHTGVLADKEQVHLLQLKLLSGGVYETSHLLVSSRIRASLWIVWVAIHSSLSDTK